MNKYKYLAKNTLVFFIGSFASKILVFLLLPLYTSVLSTSEYAISDLMNTSVNLLNMVLTLMIAEAVLRYAIDKKYDRSEVLNVGLTFIFVSSLVLGIGSLIASRMNLVKLFEGYWLQFFLLYFFYSLNYMLAGFMRGIEKVKMIAITGVIATLVTVTSNIILLVVFNFGISGYITSMILANLVSCVMYIVFGRAYKYFSFKLLNINLMGEMIKYSSPVFIADIAWWLNSSSDRYLVTWVLGASEAGLLSAAHRLPSILTIFTGIFMQAWKLSAIKEFESESSQRFFSKMLNLYNSLLIFAGSLVIIFIKPISSLVFKGDFSTAWYLVPLFILGFVINGVSAFLGTFYIANKNTKSLMTSTLIGSVISVSLTYILIGRIGTIGTGISVVISYLTISIIRIVQVKKKISLDLEFKRIIPSYLLLITLTAVVTVDMEYAYIIATVILIILVYLNRSHIISIMNAGISFIKKTFNKKL
jgi:O-antigen/teichoic acid export membrane protein